MLLDEGWRVLPETPLTLLQANASLFSENAAGWPLRTTVGGVFWDSEPKVLVAKRGGRPSGLLTDGSLLLHSLLLEHLLKSWERIPKKVRS